MIPGLKQAKYVQDKIRELGIQDIQLFFDGNIEPQGMWVMCQIQKISSGLILPKTYNENGIKPYILWYIKDNDSRYRHPSDQDISDVVATVHRSQKSWKMGGDWMADRLDEQSNQKDLKHRENFKKKIHAIAPEMKKAVRKELG